MINVDAVDQLARDSANDARNLILTHEQVCAERWKSASSSLSSLNATVTKMYNQMWLVAGSVILSLIGCVGYLINLIVTNHAATTAVLNAAK